MSKKYLWSIVAIFMLNSCSDKAINYPPNMEPDEDIDTKFSKEKNIAIFIDGTANDPNSNTNVKQLHSMVNSQKDRNDIVTSYINGVGTGAKIFGMGLGWGIGNDVREAYQFLLKTYRRGDKIYIFGFSRGAYASRILASLLYHAGIPDNISNEDRESFTKEVYAAFKEEKDENRSHDIKELYKKRKLLAPKPVNVAVLGLWDTVEALGWPDYDQNVDLPNGRYGDQLCNIDKAYHVLSADDSRARVFTPILLTRKHLYNACPFSKDIEKNIIKMKEDLAKKVEEVYFSGAHSDVGGGYNDSYLNGVSLNWMIKNLETTNLLPKNSGVPENIYATSHDPEAGIIWGLLYHKLNRSIHDYIKDEESLVSSIKVHDSLILRLDTNGTAAHDLTHEYDWVKHFSQCFESKKNSKAITYTHSSECKKVLEVISAK